MTAATKRLRDPRLPAGTAEDLCDDHAAVALDERPDDGVEVSPAEAGAMCGRCAEEAWVVIELGPGESWGGAINGERVRVRARRPAETLVAARSDAAEGHVAPLDLDALEARAKAATKGSTGIWSREVYEDGEDGEGPYGVHPGCHGPMIESKDIVIYETSGAVTGIADVHRAEDAAFLVAVQPSVMIALVAEMRRLRAEQRTAILAEREACALIADEYTGGVNHLRQRRAAADAP